ncbi:MAG: hypothetical protein IPO33_10435 [Saprospiraceae bacterium]|nr:hypothetical protein [Candidatus Brachybacter algidus]
MKQYFLLLLLFSVIVSMASCDLSDSGPPDSVSGYAPVYLAKVGADTIRFLPSEPTIKVVKYTLRMIFFIRLSSIRVFTSLIYQIRNTRKK